MLKKIFLISVLAWGSTVQALTLDELQTRFAQMQVVRADFVQERQIQNMARPLLSSGKMLMESRQGLWWYQEKPFEMTMVMTDAQMVQITNKQAPQVITAESNPQMFQFSTLLRGLFNADREVLQQNFSIEFIDLGNEQWLLRLKPIISPLDRLFQQIELHGEQYINRIIIFDQQGDITQIDFKNEGEAQTPLTEEERAYFAY